MGNYDMIKQRLEILYEDVRKLEASSTSYTKAETDEKFLTKLAAASTYIEDEGAYFTLNGIRVYVSSTAPTGTIPEGSIGIGF